MLRKLKPASAGARVILMPSPGQPARAVVDLRRPHVYFTIGFEKLASILYIVVTGSHEIYERGFWMRTVGHSPLIRIDGIFAKLECTNPCGSIKDRIALYLLEESEKRGLLRKGTRVIEATSGNTGIAFAYFAKPGSPRGPITWRRKGSPADSEPLSLLSRRLREIPISRFSPLRDRPVPFRGRRSGPILRRTCHFFQALWRANRRKSRS